MTKAKTCVWTDDTDMQGTWQPSCVDPSEQLWYLDNGSPKENGMKYCCFCGKPLTERKSKT
jgi:hypothetical protein